MRKAISNVVMGVIILAILIMMYEGFKTLEDSLHSCAKDKANTEMILARTMKTMYTIEKSNAWYKDVLHKVFNQDVKPGEIRSTTINLSSYNPLEEQCDDTPLVASDNGLVAPGILALPKHYRLLLGIPLGTLVWAPPYGQFVIRDHMNSRIPIGRGDVISFIPGWSKRFGIDNMATMYWVVKNTNNSQNE